MGERLIAEVDCDQELLRVSRDFCKRIIRLGKTIVSEREIKDGGLVDLLTCENDVTRNVRAIAEIGVHVPSTYFRENKRISMGNFYIAYRQCPQASGLSLGEAHNFVLRYAQELGFLDSGDLWTERPKLRETARAKRVRLKHPTMPVEMSLRLSGDLMAEGFRLDFVTR